MSKSNSWENSLLLLLFNNTAVANVGDATGLRGSTTAGSLYASLHTADPGEAGDQTTSEATYTSLRARRGRAQLGRLDRHRQLGVAGGRDHVPGGHRRQRHGHALRLGTASSGAGVLLYSGTVTPNIVTGNGITPQLTTATAITED
jgi:hypothetical protein